jgi:alanyl-tRNA synthetase
MGLERCAQIMQNVLSVYETDAFDYLVARSAELAGKRYGDDDETDFALRVLAEHARSVTFLIADGVAPSNEGRGYVLRRILRRAVRYARKAGIEGPFLTGLAEAVIEHMEGQYPELSRERDFIHTMISGEEERFSQTLDAGIELLEKVIARTRAGSGGDIVAGDEVFALYDTYGFPPDITHDIAREHGLEVDLEGFERAMEAQRQRGRANAKFGLGDKILPEVYRGLGLAADGGGTSYESLVEDTVVIGLLRAGEPAQNAVKGEPVEIILRETPFYAEAGGQVGDSGEIEGPSGRVRITDTQSPVEGLIAHQGDVIDGAIAVGDSVRAAVDVTRRGDVIRNHTGTHLLHAALRRILGPHVRQAGSLVAPDRLRFDFSHPSGLSATETTEIQSLVNDRILDNLPVTHRTMSYDKAIAAGALAFFGEKYGAVVRTCRIGDGEAFSFELCGGTHTDATGEIGLLHIESEGSIAAGTRRIEAVTGHGSEGLLTHRHALLESVAKQLQTSPAELSTRIGSLLQELDTERKRAAGLERDLARRQAESLQSQTKVVDGVTVLTSEVAGVSADALREIGAWLRDRLDSGIVVLGAVIEDRPSFVAMVTADLISKGYSAGNIVREVAKAAGGGGGGRPDAAQGAGKDPAKLAEALELVPALVKKA